jgi:hypothetical protein
MLLAGFSIVRSVRDLFFGSPLSSGKNKQRPAATGKKTSRKQTDTQEKQKKIFNKDEGEYIDYEEIK